MPDRPPHLTSRRTDRARHPHPRPPGHPRRGRARPRSSRPTTPSSGSSPPASAAPTSGPTAASPRRPSRTASATSSSASSRTLGSEVSTLKVGDFVIAPFALSDGTCVHCRNGVHTSCANGAWWGGEDERRPADRRRAGRGRPGADGRRDAGRDAGPCRTTSMIAGLLTLSDVMGTGHHAARLRRRRPGSTVVVVGDGAVGRARCIAAKRLGAERIIAMSRHADRQALARDFGATDIVERARRRGRRAGRGAARRDRRRCRARVRRHQGVDAAGDRRHPSGRPGRLRRRAGRRLRAADPPAVLQQRRRWAAVWLRCAATSPSCSTDVLSGAIDPGRVFDLQLPLEQAPEAYAAMDERRSIKTMLRP